ncbi:MAG: tRNA lysidine(34) synthetase TilS [Actinomycetota bacterium]
MSEGAGGLHGPGLAGPGFDLVERTGRTIARHGLFSGEPGESVVVVAVSGGPDSMCLLDVLVRLRSTFGLTLHVAHVDHGLSEASGKVAAAVARHAAGAGLEVHLTRAPEGLGGPNLQARARAFRYGFLETIAARLGVQSPPYPASVATGHTLDDRVETTVARLIHGAGTSVLAGLRPVGEAAHPLIASRRAETRAYCEERALAFFDDPANEDAAFERAAVRREVIAPIERRWGDGAIRAMARSSERLAEDADALETLMFEFYEREARGDADDRRRFSLVPFLELPRAVRRRVLELAVGRVRDRSAGIDEVLDALDRTDRSGERRFAIAGGVEVLVGSTELTVIGPAPEEGS